MSNENIGKILNAQDTLYRQLEPIVKAIESISSIQPIVEAASSYQELLRVTLGPIEDLRLAGQITLASQLTSGFTKLLDQEKQFLLPKLSDAADLFNIYINRPDFELLSRYSQQVSDLQGFMETMHAPWLNVTNQLQSINGFTGLHGIGSLLQTLPPFDTKLTDILRLDLGDWHEKVILPPSIATDPLFRTSLYTQQGFNPDLTTFPHPAFEEIVTKAGLRIPDFPVAKGYDLDRESDDLQREAAFERTNNAHDLLQRFESHLRKFIDERMEAKFGDSWTKHRIPGDLRNIWRDKQRKDTGIQNWPMIAYADFTDYVTIITRNDNWRDLFEAVFVNKSSVQESFRRLYPIRLATMHARPITHDDELYLYVETKRIMSAIGIN